MKKQLPKHFAIWCVLLSGIFVSLPGAAQDVSVGGNYDSRERKENERGPDVGAMASTAAAPRTPAIKTITSFSQALRCMDDLFLAHGKRNIYITSPGIVDETGKVKVGYKEMLITAISKMTVKSEAFHFIDFHSGGGDLTELFNTSKEMGKEQLQVPNFYLRGSISQMDDNAVRKTKGFGISLPFLDFGTSKDDSYDLITMDASVGVTATRRILPTTSTSNTMIIMKGGNSTEVGGKIGKVGFSFNMDLSRTEGLGATTRALVELTLIEALGKFTQVPYWRCLDADITNPLIRDQARETFDTLRDKERILFVQKKLGGSMGRYKGPLDGMMNPELKEAIAKYQADTHLIANGQVDFDLYASLLDDVQNTLAAVPGTQPASATTGRISAPASFAAAAVPASYAQPVATNSFRMSFETEKGTRPNYQVGEFLNMNLMLSTDGDVFCYYEDASRKVARIFPNQFVSNSYLKGGHSIRLPNGGFRIRFDQPGKERVACLGSNQQVVVPPSLKGAKDLTPLQVRSLEDVISMYRSNNPGLVANQIEISISSRR